MKKLGLGLGLVIALLTFWPGTADLKVAPNRTATQQPGATPAQAQNPSQDNYEQKRADFKSGRELLIRKGVPFDPDILLEDDWRERVNPFLGQMPQMSRARRMSNKLSGAHLADTLYLPEKIELTGDTIIMARRLVFEGQQILITGPHNIYVYVIEPEEISAVSQESLTKKLNPRFAKAGFTAAVTLKSKDVNITIDVSALSYEEWLHQQQTSQAARTTRRGQLVKAGYFRAHSYPQTPANGTNGNPGNPGPPATNGAQANPLLGTKGPDGVCGTSTTVNGGPGQAGGHGGDAGDGNNGQAGQAGGGGGTIYFTTGSTGTYTFQARGGDGGRGGDGSPGGIGAPGGSGGPGGDGKDCPCTQGGAGTGGRGGDAGFGGDGGDGGDGGPGGVNGPGGAVHVTKPYGSSPTLIFLNQGGSGGQGGAGQSTGFGGAAGNAGGGGSGVTGTFGCGNGNTGGSGSSAGPGSAGNVTGVAGASQPPGANGGVTVCQTQPPGSPPCPGGTWLCNGWQCYSPIIVDTDGDGFDLTDAVGGVNFDFFGNGHSVPLSWTTSSADDSWLTLDRNGDGMVESGRELFGNLTPQPTSDHPNGFIALGVYDKPEDGGNGDGVLDRHDAIFQSLRLWQDTNHNGISEPGELHSLPDLDVESISLEYKESISHGNCSQHPQVHFGLAGALFSIIALRSSSVRPSFAA
jgi:hypothetical protein